MSYFLVNDSGHYLGQSLINDTGKFPQNESENATIFECDTDFKFYIEKCLHWMYTLTLMHSAAFYVFAQGTFFVVIIALGQLGAEFRSDLEKIKNQNGRIEKVKCIFITFLKRSYNYL